MQLRTVESLVKEQFKKQIVEDQYMFCATSSCDVVYFSTDPDHWFSKEALKVPVTQKDEALSVPLCYCFGITRQKVIEDLERDGNTTVVDDISQKIKQGVCTCETTNPQGSCCLGNVSKWIKGARKLFADKK